MIPAFFRFVANQGLTRFLGTRMGAIDPANHSGIRRGRHWRARPLRNIL